MSEGLHHDAEVRAEAWDEGYDMGYRDCTFDDRGLRTDPDANEHPHENPYRAALAEEGVDEAREDARLRTLGHNAAAHYAYEMRAERDDARAALARVEALCDEAEALSRRVWDEMDGNPKGSWPGRPQMSVNKVRAALSPATQQDGDGR